MDMGKSIKGASEYLKGSTSNMSGTIQFFVNLVVAGAVLYAEIMFLNIIGIAFPNGLIGSLAMVGAFVTGASFMLLYFGKKHWFIMHSAQFIAAVCFTAVEIFIMAANAILAYMMATHQDLGYLATWRDITPASPMVAIIGWAVVTYLDRSNVLKQAGMKMEAEKEELDMIYELTAYKAQHTLRMSHLNQVVAGLDDALGSDAAQQQVSSHSQRMVAKVLTDATGINAFSSNVPRIAAPAPTPIRKERDTDPAITPLRFEQSAEVDDRPLA